MPDVICNVCGRASALAGCEQATVRSNVRAFRDERFAVWRCPHCRSIHARDEVDLSHYYARYPRFAQSTEERLAPAYRNFLRRLTRAGLAPGATVLDYGCATGSFVRFLRANGHPDTQGYDAYTEAFARRAVLDVRYDCVVSQDVIEHVPSPNELLASFERLAVPGGLVTIGTPDADAIDLTRPQDYVHVLHAPYHRHIVSRKALCESAQARGWSLVRFHSTMYSNTPLPGQNPRFGLHYLRCYDDCLDLFAEPVRLDSWRLFAPDGLFWLFCGYFFDRHTDVMFTFRTPA